jgi:hypothetical protein
MKNGKYKMQESFSILRKSDVELGI